MNSPSSPAAGLAASHLQGHKSITRNLDHLLFGGLSRPPSGGGTSFAPGQYGADLAEVRHLQVEDTDDIDGIDLLSGRHDCATTASTAASSTATEPSWRTFSPPSSSPCSEETPTEVDRSRCQVRIGDVVVGDPGGDLVGQSVGDPIDGGRQFVHRRRPLAAISPVARPTA